MSLLCASPTCGLPNRHTDGCDGTDCRGCLPAQAADPWRFCASCADRPRRDLAAIAHHWGWLPILLEHGSAPTGPRVSGGDTSGAPLRLGVLDLLLPARVGHLTAALRGILGDPDQIGHLPVATELDTWVRDWASLRGEHLPVPTVPRLAAWLTNRLDWALTYHDAIDEFAANVAEIAATLRAVAGDTPPAPERCVGVPCRRCDTMALYRLPGEDRVECGQCGTRWTEDEHQGWVRLVAANVRGDAA